MTEKKAYKVVNHSNVVIRNEDGDVTDEKRFYLDSINCPGKYD
jgi:hypothetical protein